MEKGRIIIGTSGWSYKEWKGIFYPQTLAAKDWLSYYSTVFPVTEINSSFYHLPRKETIYNWMDKVSPHFIFCPKISRFLTHMKKLHDPAESLQPFFEIFEPMRKRMGPVLVQLPPSLKFDPNIVKDFYSILTTKYKEYKFAIEPRHLSWLERDSVSLMEKNGISFVISQSGKRFPYDELVTAHDIYVRFHGPDSLYASLYSDSELQRFAKLFHNWQTNGHVVWAFFNNDIHGYAVKNALMLEDMCRDLAAVKKKKAP